MDELHSRRRFLKRSCTGVGAAVVAGSMNLTATPTPPAGLAGTGIVPRRPLGKTGWLVSIVGFGGGSQFMGQADLDVVEKMIHRAVGLGINYFDTAYGYTQKGERESFRRYATFLVPKHRANVKISSKLAERDAETAKKSFEQTLTELGTDHIDVLHFHALASKEDVDKLLAPDGALKVYRQWKDQGVIKAIGISGHTSGDIMVDAIRRLEPDCVMCPMNPAHSGSNSGHDFEKVVPFALERGLGVLAMKTTARKGLIGKNGVTAEQLVRYTLNLPVAAAVIGMPSLEVLESCADIARSLQPITETERKGLQDKLARAATDGSLPYLTAGYWDGQPCIG